MASGPISVFLEYILPVFCKISFLRYWLLSHITIVETMDSGEREMNLVTMTIINQKKYLPGRVSNKRPPVLQSFTPLTDLCGLSPKHLRGDDISNIL